MRVLHVVTGLHAGGAERQLALLLRHLPADQEHEVAALTNPGTVARELRADGFTVHHLDMRGNRDLGVLPRLTRLIRSGRYDLVHTHLYRAMLYGRLAARLAGVRTVIATEHSLQSGVIEGRPTSRGVKALYLGAERLGTTTIAVSGQVAEVLGAWGVPADRVRLLPNGVDAARYRFTPAARAAHRGRLRAQLGLPIGVFVIGAVGRLVPGKRFHVPLEALVRLPDARLLLIGEGPERAALLDRAAELGVRDRLVLTGERDDVPELLTAVDVLVSPSREETFGLAALEGLAAGLPLLHSACPALAELPPDAAPHARLLPSEPESYARELALLATTRPGLLPVPPAVAHYDIAHLATELATLYRESLPTPRRTPHRPPPAPGSAAGSAPGTGDPASSVLGFRRTGRKPPAAPDEDSRQAPAVPSSSRRTGRKPAGPPAGNSGRAAAGSAPPAPDSRAPDSRAPDSRTPDSRTPDREPGGLAPSAPGPRRTGRKSAGAPDDGPRRAPALPPPSRRAAGKPGGRA
ncbi:glycosyltransferase [Kitasatospora sp. NA04385]|uniref:glycosyltransferase n=1 Tax=Kitasatospora sp. NA04385 TaxID=2742135 RepID=UPI00158FFFA8|nr:glycosyltransferase [Kitasatospora sp. NA04385]